MLKTVSIKYQQLLSSDLTHGSIYSICLLPSSNEILNLLNTHSDDSAAVNSTVDCSSLFQLRYNSE